MRRLATWARYLGAVALLGVGLDHLEQFSVDHYSAVPTIGTLFALNFASAALLAIGLLAPVRRLPGRAGRWAVPVLACGGIGVAAGSLAGLAASESVGLFGFMESGYRGAIVLSIALEVATILLLAVARPTRDRRGRAGAPADPMLVVRVDDGAERRIDELQDRLRGLVAERGVLEAEEAGDPELRENHHEITRTRERLWRALESSRSPSVSSTSSGCSRAWLRSTVSLAAHVVPPTAGPEPLRRVPPRPRSGTARPTGAASARTPADGPWSIEPAAGRADIAP